MTIAKAIFINNSVYVGGASESDANNACYFPICKFDTVKSEWNTLPPAPVRLFGIGQLNGKLVIAGGIDEGGGETGDVHFFEEDTQQWVKSIPPMPAKLAVPLVTSYGSSLIVCGIHDDTAPASMFVYNSQSSQWCYRSPPPLLLNSLHSSAVTMNGQYYIAIGAEDVIDSENWLSSPAVFSLPLRTLLDPNAPLDPSSWHRMPDTLSHTPHLAAIGGCLLALGGLVRACNLQDPDKIAALLTDSINAFCSATSSWVKVGELPDLRAFPAITSEKLFIAGGASPTGEHTKVFTGTINLL